MKDIILDIPKGYEFFGVDDNNKVVLKPIQHLYPQTFDECCKVLGIDYLNCVDYVVGYKRELLKSLQKLLICRDAYWKIAGEEMGFGESWKPNWNESTPKYAISVIENKLVKPFALTQNYVIAFPSEKKRDDFYENFKELIEQCKELL